MQVVLHGLVFNAKYWVSVAVSGVPAQTTVFYTPRCPHVDRAFTRCVRTASSLGRQGEPPRTITPPGGKASNHTDAAISKGVCLF